VAEHQWWIAVSAGEQVNFLPRLLLHKGRRNFEGSPAVTGKRAVVFIAQQKDGPPRGPSFVELFPFVAKEQFGDNSRP